jgi:uncharacterized membrane protein
LFFISFKSTPVFGVFMNNMRTIGLAMMASAVILFLIGFSYVRSAESALLEGHTTGSSGECVHEEAAVCPYQQLSELSVPKHVGLFADIVLFLAGLFLFLRKTPEEKVLHKAKGAAKALGGDESKVFELVTQSDGMIFQNELVEKMGVSKVKITRILDRLEAKGLIERRRRGMTNVIVLK